MSDSDIDRKEVKEMPEEVQADLNADPITRVSQVLILWKQG